jgi:Domain of unknown function (DUF4160)
MPRISAFYGITIWMYHDEAHHRGRPHFHASYGGDEATIDIESLALIAGGLPPRAHRLVVEWAMARRSELRENWVRARRHQPLTPVEPLR